MRKPASQDTYNIGPWEHLMHGSVTERHGRGDVVYAPAQPAADLFVLVSGQVGLYLQSAEQRTLMLRELEPGQIFGHVAISGHDRYDTFAEALGPVVVQRVPRAVLQQRIAETPDLALALLDDLGQHQALVSRHLDEVAFKSVPARLASLLIDMAHRHDQAASTHVPRRSHRQLAEMINAYRETVTKQINQFHAARLLEIDHSGITLVNLTRLKELAQG